LPKSPKRVERFGKNANLALALDVQTSNCSRHRPVPTADQDQHEGATGTCRCATWWAGLHPLGDYFIGVTGERGDVESLRNLRRPTSSIASSSGLSVRCVSAGDLEPSWAESAAAGYQLTRRINNPDKSFGGIVTISIEPRYLTDCSETTTSGPAVISLVPCITLARRAVSDFFGEDISSRIARGTKAHPVGTYIGPGGVFAPRVRVMPMRDYPVIATVGAGRCWRGSVSAL
jgi:hypothetical protein